MVDPASVAGFISLSLQVVQGLERYYSQFVSFHDEIKGINTRIEGLHAILHDFEQSIGRFDLREDAIWGKVQACLTACRASLKDLEAYQRRCSEPRYDPGTLTRRLELGKLRLLYPFKKETLGGLHAVLDRLVENLQTALQVLQCNTMITLHDQAEVRDKRTHHQLSHVRQNQSYQTKLLETIKDRLGASENRVQELFGSQATRISALERQLALLIPMVGQLQTRKDEWPPPLLLRNEAGGDKSLADHSIYYPYKVHRQYGESQMFEAYGLVPIYCSCSTPPQKLNCTPSRGTVSFYWTERFKHAPSCPKFLPSQWIIHAGIRFAARFWRLGYLLEARLVWSTRSIAAHVECQRLVPNNAPAFRLVYMLLQMCATPGNHLALGRALPLTLCCLIQLFKDKRASPNDVNTYGQTFFHIVVRPMALGMGEDALTMSDSAEAVNSFLRILIEMGLDLNAKDDKGFTPLDCFVGWLRKPSRAIMTTRDIIIPALANLECSWMNSVSRFVPKMASDTVGFKEIYRRFCLKDTCQSGLTDSPLAMSVLQQSEASLLDALLHQQKATIPETDRFIIHAAADWPEGLRLMISHGVDCSGIAYNGASALDYACSYGNPVSVWLLLEADAPVTQYTWHHAIQSQNMDIINKVAEALHRAWQETSPDDMACQSMFCLLYQDWALAIDSAQAAFDAGFVDVDMHLHSDGKDLLCSTPLWTKAQTLQKQDLSDTLDLLEWLVERGASLDFIPCGHTTMPAHVAAERIAILCSVGKTYERYEDESLANELSHPWLTMLQNHADFLSVIYSSDHIDHCNCGCSKHGCTVVSAALKTTTQAYSTARPEATDLALKKNILHAIFSFIDAQHKSDDIIAAEILRVLTFDRLQLTHTCHDITRFDGEYFSCPSPHIKLDGRDIADIQYIEQCDLQLLEGLLEEFEDAWKTRQTGSTLLQFLDGHWDRRMSEVIAERLRPRKDEFERLRLVGVERVVFGPERKPERERKLEREAAEVGSWEWFEKEVESIMAAK